MSLTKFLSVTMCLVSVLSMPLFAGQASASSDSKMTSRADEATNNAASTNNKNVEMRNGFKVFYGKWNHGVRLGCGIKRQTFSPGSSANLKLILQCRAGQAQLHIKFAPYIQNKIRLVQKKSRHESVLTEFGKSVRAAGPVFGSTILRNLSPGDELSCVLSLSRMYDLSTSGEYFLSVRRSIYIRGEDGYRKVDYTASPILLKVRPSLGESYTQRLMSDKERKIARGAVKATSRRIKNRARKEHEKHEKGSVSN